MNRGMLVAVVEEREVFLQMQMHWEVDEGGFSLLSVSQILLFGCAVVVHIFDGERASFHW